MKVHFFRAVFGALVLMSFSAQAQMHRVARPEQVVRAIGVYEWTGDLSKPKASRLIPVSVFVNGKLEDAGVYVARPVPFALLTGNVYELQSAGIDKAVLDLAYARHLQAVDSTGDSAWDDGWFGYGSVKPLAVPKKPVLKASKGPLPAVVTSKGSAASTGSGHPQLQPKTSGDATSTSTGQSSTSAGQSKTGSDTGSGTDTSSASNSDPDRPTMKRRSSSDESSSGTTGTTSSNTPTTDAGTGKSSGSTTTSDDPDRPTMKRRSDNTGDTTSTASTSDTPADDPDRPTMKRRSDSSGTSDSSTTSTPDSGSAKGSGNTPADDSDRPTMKRRSSDSTTDSTTTASTTGSTSADDPDRPTLKRHSPEDAKKRGNNDAGSVTGVGSLNDDPSRPTLHHGKPTSAMTETDLPKLSGLPEDLHQIVAVSDAVDREPHEFAIPWENDAQRAEVLEKVQTLARAQLAAYGGKPAPAASASAPKTAAAAKARRPAKALVAAPEPLLDEELKGYMLSYGGAATYVYSAHTGGTGAGLRYVTIVVQADGLGDLKPAIQSVTDAAHLDRTPRMQFVDVVDAEASNRASLLFELRSQNSRQFGLYRVIAARSEQTFLTGTTQ